MSVKNWNVRFGLFSSASNWSQSGTPVAGDDLFIKNGGAILFNQTFGSTESSSSIGLTSDTASAPSRLIVWNADLQKVTIDNAPASYTGQPDQKPTDYNAGRHGYIDVGGRVTNDGGLIEAGRGDIVLPGNSLDIVVASGSTLINTGPIGATPGNTMAVTGSQDSTLENSGTVFSSGANVTISAHLTGSGDVNVNRGPGFSGSMEINAAVDAGQTFHLFRAALQIDQPLGFLGQIDSNTQGGRVTLEGLAATSWDISGSSVEFLNAAGSVVDTLRFTTPQASAALTVYSVPDATYGSAMAVNVGPGFGAPTSGSLLPYHTAMAA